MPSRAQLLVLHRRLALLFAPLLFLQALSGMVLLFKAELLGLTVPAPVGGQQSAALVPLSSLVMSARAALPEHRVSRIYLPGTPRDPAMVHLTGQDGLSSRYVALDPGNGQVLAAGPIWRFPVEAALQWHYRLNDGRFGLAVVLLNGAALVFLGTTGMLYWWPGRRRMLAALAVKPAAPARARLRQWHRSIGVSLVPLAMFSAVTGILLVVPDLLAPAGAATAWPQPAGAAQIDRAFTHARDLFPQAAVRDVRFPAADRIDVNFHAPRYNSQAIDLVSVRLSDGAVIKRMPAEDNPALWITVLPLHSGTALGAAGLVVLSIEGLALLILAATGPLMWWQARRPKRKKT